MFLSWRQKEKLTHLPCNTKRAKTAVSEIVNDLLSLLQLITFEFTELNDLHKFQNKFKEMLLLATKAYIFV